MSLSFCILSILENLGKGEGDQSRRTARRLQKKPKKEKEKDKTISLCVDSCCKLRVHVMVSLLWKIFRLIVL